MRMYAQGSPFGAGGPEPLPPEKTPEQKEALARRDRELARKARR
jgi:hypothetical protein